MSADRPYDIGDGMARWNDHVMQWLDITDEPAVPREAVQAAVDEMRDKADGAILDTQQEIAAVGIRGSIGCITHHTGVVPSVVKDSLITVSDIKWSLCPVCRLGGWIKNGTHIECTGVIADGQCCAYDHALDEMRDHTGIVPTVSP
jgi:hypothetical protein